jgi:hypothetical protein
MCTIIDTPISKTMCHMSSWNLHPGEPNRVDTDHFAQRPNKRPKKPHSVKGQKRLKPNKPHGSLVEVAGVLTGSGPDTGTGTEPANGPATGVEIGRVGALIGATATGMEGRTGGLTGARTGVPGGVGPVGEALGVLSCCCWVVVIGKETRERNVR